MPPVAIPAAAPAGARPRRPQFGFFVEIFKKNHLLRVPHAGYTENYRTRSPIIARRSRASPPPYGAQGYGRGQLFDLPGIIIVRL